MHSSKRIKIPTDPEINKVFQPNGVLFRGSNAIAKNTKAKNIKGAIEMTRKLKYLPFIVGFFARK